MNDISVKYKAFVLMPFSAEFDDVYKYVISENIAVLGFVTTRADDTKNSRNIMHDVIQGIYESDLIIADITGANPNVYYELGIAHTLAKKVVLLVQDIEDVPFDLRAYRVITYSTHFARVEEAKEQLLETARNALDQSIPFGNPVKDYFASEKQSIPSTQLIPILTNENNSLIYIDQKQDEVGILDIVIGLQDGMGVLTEIMGEVALRMSNLGPSVEETTAKLVSPQFQDPYKQRIIIRELASELNEYATWLKQGNSRYRGGLSIVTESLDSIFTADLSNLPNAQKDFQELFSTVDEIERSALGCQESMFELSQTMDNLPPIEKEFNRSKKRLSEEIKSLILNIDLTISSLSRVKGAVIQVESLDVEQ